MARRSRYSLFVRAMRIVLPVCALALLTLVVVWPRLNGFDDLIQANLDGVDLEQDGRVRLANPRYVGEASDGAAYSVEAESARVDPVKPRRVELEQMRATLPVKGSGDVSLEAREAVYDRNRALIELGGGVELTTADGYRLRTEAATVALKAGTVRSSTPVAGDGPRGDLRADRMEVDERGDVIRFIGDVHVTLQNVGTTQDRGS